MIIKQPPAYDVSHWKVIPDFTALDPKPVIVITKATEGKAGVDSKFTTYYPAIRAAGYARGCFHFHRKAAYSTSVPYSQAEHFCETIKPYVTDGDILVLDLEEGGETARMMIDWFTYVQLRYPNNQMMLYSRKNLLDAIPMNQAEREFMKLIPTWPAGYPLDPDQYDSIPSFYIPDPTRYGPPWLWQYTAKGKVKGIYGNVDMTYLGDVDCNWIASALLERINQSPPEEQPMDQYVTGTANPGAGYSLNVRSGPSTSNAIIGSLPHGAAFTGWLSNGWIKIDYQGQTGYIMASWTNYTVSEPPVPGEKPAIEITYDPALVNVTLKAK